MKKILFFLAFMAVILPAFSEKVQIGDLYYNLNSSKKTAEVTYINNNSNYVSGSISIPETVTYEGSTYSVTSIGEYAFFGCTGLTNIEIPNSVTSIGEYAFQGCSSLTGINVDNDNPSYSSSDGILYSKKMDILICCPGGKKGILTIPNSVTYIETAAFYGCSGLTGVVIPNSVTSIGASAFTYCSGLTSIEIPNSVIEIGRWAFYDCNGLLNVEFNAENCTYCGSSGYPAFPYTLTGVTIGSQVKSIPDYAFDGCTGLTSVVIPNSVTSIGWAAFSDCSGLTSVTIGNSVTSIEDYAFFGCSGLTGVEIPNSVTSIGKWAFCDCGLTSVTIGNSVTSIGNYAFRGCGLTQIVLKSENPPSYYDAFSEYAEKATLTLPDLANLSAYLLSDWRNFLSINLTSGNFFTGSDDVFQYSFIESRGKAILLQASNYNTMQSVSIPDRVVADRNGVESFYQVTGIGADAFKGCSNLAQVKLPANCMGIGANAFSGCSKLPSIDIPNSVTYIGESAFSGCSSLTKVTTSDIEAWCNIDFGNSTANPIYYAKILYLNSNTITSLSIPQSITEIKNYAFYNCSSLTDIEIPSSVMSIGKQAFSNISFKDFVIEDGIDALEWNGENNIKATNLYVGRNTLGPVTYSSIENLEFGAFVESIPAKMFNKATLTSLIINPGSGIVIENEAFKGCKNLTEITLPEDIAEIGDDAFSGTALKNVTVPNGIIGANAFAGCNLDNIIIGAGVESIGEKAFDGSNTIKNVYATPVTPPAAENNTFSYYEAQLYVPAESIDTYYNYTRCWYRFSGKPLVMPESIEVTGPTVIKGEAGETFRLTATISPSNVTLDRVLWRSTNPAIATVDNDGVVTINNFVAGENGMARADYLEGFCDIIASTLYEDSPVAMVRIEALSTSIDYINPDGLGSGWQNGNNANDIFTLQGVCLKRGASQSDIDALAPGFYIIGGKKVVVK